MMNVVMNVSSQDYRFRLDFIDPERSGWEAGDCRVKIDVRDGVNEEHHALLAGCSKPPMIWTRSRPARLPVPSRGASCGTGAAPPTTTSTTSSGR